jgi:heme oxygenase
MHQVVAGMETSLCHRLSAIVPDMQERLKRQWIEEDLTALGYRIDEPDSFILSDEYETLSYALGAFYVLEGSTLGGRVILKSLPKSIGLSGDGGRCYFAGYGADTGARWESFLANLCNYALSNHCEEEVIAGANRAFADILDYFNYSCAHEAQRHCQS